MGMSVSSIGSYSFIDRMAMNAMGRGSRTQGKEFDPSRMVSKILEKEDTDGNGEISSSETRLDSSMFSQMDTDSNGSLTTEELTAGLEKVKPRPPMAPPPGGRPRGPGGPGGAGGAGRPEMDASKVASSIMENEDSNSDGVLSIDETGLETAQYNLLDTDGDGKVTLEELQAGVEARKTEMDQQMSSVLQQQELDSESGTNDIFQSLMTAMSQNGASKAYSDQSWLYDMLQSSMQAIAFNA